MNEPGLHKFKEKNFWVDLYKAGWVKTQLPPVKAKAGTCTTLSSCTFKISSEQSERILNISGGSDVKLFILLKSALLILLKKYCQSNDLTLGVPIYKQSSDSLVNTILPLRIQVDDSRSFRSLLQQSSQMLFKANENQNYRMEALLYHLGLDSGDPDGYPLFDVVCLLDNIHFPHYIDGLRVGLVFCFTKAEKEISCCIKFNAEKYSEQFISLLFSNFTHTINCCVDDLEQVVGDIDVVSESERDRMRDDWNNTDVELPAVDNVVDWFISSARENTNRMAIVFYDHQISYGYLNERSNALASHLQKQGVVSGQIVPLVIEKSPEMIFSILAIIKCGAAYLPIDIGLPLLRKQSLIAESGSKIVVGNSKYAGDLDAIFVDPSSVDLGEESADFEVVHQDGSQLMYALFTSGSTGNPKGILVEHRNVINLMNWFGRVFDINQEKRILMFSDYTFDTSIEDIFGALLHGALLVIPTKNSILDQHEFRVYMEQNWINHLSTVPSFLETIAKAEPIVGLDVIISGGEALKEDLKKSLMTKGYTVYNTYGPSETTVEVLYTRCSDAPVNLGSPIDNTTVYVVTQQGGLAPVGVVGEICFSGNCVTRGYLNNPELTDEKFSKSVIDDRRTYLTGDFGKWQPNGTIDFAGRRDEQVKIRGHRVELLEIQKNMLKINGVRDVVIVLKNKDTTPELYCYYISDHVINRNDIVHFLLDRLPRYMIPSFFKRVSQFPMLANGKINKMAFDQSEYMVEDEEKEIALPSDEVEAKLLTIWKSILTTDRVSVYDNFFEIGGDSLKIVQLQNALKTNVSEHISVLALFRYPSIHSFAKYLRSQGISEQEPVSETQPAPEPRNKLAQRLQRATSSSGDSGKH